MIKRLIQKLREFLDGEREINIELELSIYDLLFAAFVFIGLVVWLVFIL